MDFDGRMDGCIDAWTHMTNAYTERHGDTNTQPDGMSRWARTPAHSMAPLHLVVPRCARAVPCTISSQPRSQLNGAASPFAPPPLRTSSLRLERSWTPWPTSSWWLRPSCSSARAPSPWGPWRGTPSSSRWPRSVRQNSNPSLLLPLLLLPPSRGCSRFLRPSCRC